MARGNDAHRPARRRRVGGAGDALVRRALRAQQSGRELPAPPRRRARRPRAADARQRGAALGDDARLHEARRGDRFRRRRCSPRRPRAIASSAGSVTHVVAGAAHAAKFATLHRARTPRSRSAASSRAGAASTRRRGEPADVHARRRRRAPSDPLLLYFTSGTTAKPKLVLHTHASYPVGHLSTMYWIGLQPGDVHWNISSPGWAKHAWSSFFAPWNAGATRLRVQLRALRRAARARRARRAAA